MVATKFSGVYFFEFNARFIDKKLFRLRIKLPISDDRNLVLFICLLLNRLANGSEWRNVAARPSPDEKYSHEMSFLARCAPALYSEKYETPHRVLQA